MVQIDGFEQDKKVVVIAATNRKQDLDPALIRYAVALTSLYKIIDLGFSDSFYFCSFSRFDSMIMFGLPDQQTRQEIAAQYAKHLTKSELAEFAIVTEE